MSEGIANFIIWSLYLAIQLLSGISPTDLLNLQPENLKLSVKHKCSSVLTSCKKLTFLYKESKYTINVLSLFVTR